MKQLFRATPTSIRILVVADPDAMTASFITEKFVREFPPRFDAIIACGPFSPVKDEIRSLEEEATALGDMASIIAQLENIVCRVMYLAAESDPIATLARAEQLHITPNSVNIYARKLPLIQGLHVTGLTEKSSDLVGTTRGENEDEEEEDDNVRVQASLSTSEIIDQILFSNHSAECIDKLTMEKYSLTVQASALSSSSSSSSSPSISAAVPPTPTGSNIFVFNYKYAHSLSQFLFHSTDEIEASRVKLCIIPCINSSSSDALRLPSKFGNLDIAVVRSLRQTGEYLEVVCECVDDIWTIANVLSCNLNSL